MKGKVGFTTTIPVEVIFASGYTPCDLNNIFITDPNPARFIELAEREGFPRNLCNWIKGIYAVVMEQKTDAVITVLEGDCSNTRALTEILQHKGVRTIPFSYPYDRDRNSLSREIHKLMDEFGVDEESLHKIDGEIEPVRRTLEEIDRMTWQERRVTGHENHMWHVCASDMMGDYEAYGRRARSFIDEAKGRPALEGIPLGYVGVPPIALDLYEFIEKSGGSIVYNEVQRQFALPYFSGDIVERYRSYTYPYGIFPRIEDIKREVKRRGLKGIVHYVQAFCYRVIEDLILRETLGVPIITIEGDLPKALDTRSRMRLEAFIEMLRGKMDGKE